VYLLAPLTLATAGGLAAIGTYYPNCPLFGSVIGGGPRSSRDVFLTFDDGPNQSATERILETLATFSVPAAFFMVGNHARRYQEIGRLVAVGGHEVGNHTQSHVKLHLLSPRRIRRELESAHNTIAETTGVAPRFFRAPHGYRNPFVAAAVRRLGYRVFGWSFGVWDSARPGAAEIRRRVRAKLRPGAIVLLHDGDGYDPNGDRSQTAEALPGVIQDIRDRGLTFGRLSDLAS
jgi:peptidoglycan/xylan/chitin deacetylase (PgdA/CDA1 family)